MKAFALIALLLVGVSSAFAQKDTIAIINAGSSGSRLYVYEVDKGTGDVDTICTQKFSMILSDIAEVGNVQNGVASYIEAIPSISDKVKKPIDLYILATAGMRTMNEDTANVIYSKFRDFTPNNKYDIKRAMTISGRYEGLYAWIAANHNVLKGQSDWSNLSGTKGILEIGGQSMQITFKPNVTTIQATEKIDHPKGVTLYSKSYVNGGVNSVYNSVSNKANPDYSSILNLNGIGAMIGNLTFYGLGGTINGVDKVRGNAPFCNYLSGYNIDIKQDKPEAHYVFNTHYLKWVLEQLGLLANNKIVPKDADWTKGAAYDIFINNNNPESYDYKTPN